MGGITIINPKKPDVVTRIEKTPNGMVTQVIKKPLRKKAAAKKMKPQAPEISLSEPGRLRVANLMCLFNVSRTTLYAGFNTGRYPERDGVDGRIPYWNTETIFACLAKQAS